MKTTVIGIDCAVEPKKTGLALAVVEGSRTQLLKVVTGKDKKPVAIVYDWIRNSQQVLLALDAPLGWPATLGGELVRHRSGEPLEASADRLFRRETDRFVRQLTGKRPLDVGADRIARTAHAALNLISELRSLTDCSIPLVWEPTLSERIQAIEVYPAGTLAASGLPDSGYKKSKDLPARKEILTGLQDRVDTSGISEMKLLGNADILDAVVCVLAAADFLKGKSIPPIDHELAEKEGWIWVRTPV